MTDYCSGQRDARKVGFAGLGNAEVAEPENRQIVGDAQPEGGGGLQHPRADQIVRAPHSGRLRQGVQEPGQPLPRPGLEWHPEAAFGAFRLVGAKSPAIVTVMPWRAAIFRNKRLLLSATGLPVSWKTR